MTTRAVLLIAHGGVPRDMPRTMLREMKALARRGREGGEGAAEALEAAAAIEARVRAWPRTPENDPFQAGVEALATALRPRIADRKLLVAYNEFCAPSIDEALDGLAAEGIAQVDVITSMMTPGGSHSEGDIPEALERARERHPAMAIDYRWPFDMDALAALMATHLGA